MNYNDIEFKSNGTLYMYFRGFNIESGFSTGYINNVFELYIKANGLTVIPGTDIEYTAINLNNFLSGIYVGSIKPAEIETTWEMLYKWKDAVYQKSR